MMMKLLLIAISVGLVVEAIGPFKVPLTKRRSSKIKDFLNAKGANPKFGKSHQSYFSLKFNYDYFAIGAFFGTPVQRVELALDMVDRSTSVLRSSYEPLTNDQNTYDSDASSTANPVSWFNQSNHEFWVQAYNFSDVFSIDNLEYKKQYFGAIYRSWNYSDVNFELLTDGMLGFGINSVNSNETSSASLNLLKQLDNPIYTVSIENHAPPSEGSVGGQLTFGAYDTDYCGTQFYKPLPLFKGPNFFHNWVFIVSKIKIRSYVQQKDRNAYVNVGQPTLALPTGDFNGFIKQLTYTYSDGLYIIPCDQLSPPDIVFTINGTDFLVSSKHYIVDMDLGSNNCVLAAEESENTKLLGLGVPFIENYCPTVNVVDRTIDFSPILTNPD